MMALVPIAAHASDRGGGSDDDQFRGVIERLPSTAPIGDWLVSGTTVHVSAATDIDEDGNAIVVGATVEVEGTMGTDGSITATKVQIREGADDDALGEAELHGTVESLSATTGFIGDWVVSGITVHVTAATEIEAEDGMIAVGSFVEVKGLSEADGSITASKVELNNDQGDDEDGDGILTGTLEHSQSSNDTGVWMVSGHRIRVTNHTMIVRNGHSLHRGADVRVSGRWRANGSMRAQRIVVMQ
jgi:cytoskeletal protein CcmA (bactofilin family)